MSTHQKPQQPAEQQQVPLLQQGNVINSFLNQEVVVGVLQQQQSQQQQSARFGADSTSNSVAHKPLDVVGVRGTLDGIDAMCNVSLMNASAPALGQQLPARVAAFRGASVSFIGIPKKQ